VNMMQIKMQIGLKRRRNGLTSPPLTCVEANPGPGFRHEKAKRKEKKQPPKPPKKRKYFSQKECDEIKFGYDDMTEKRMAEKLGRSEQNVQEKCAEFRDSGDIVAFSYKGREKQYTEREENYVVWTSLKEPKWTAKQVALQVFKDDSEPKRKLVSRILISHGLNSYKARKKPLLRKQNIKARSSWAWTHRVWTNDDWNDVFWSDESPFELWQLGQNVMVRRRAGVDDPLKPEFCEGTIKFGGGKIQVWGGFSRKEMGPLKRIVGIMTKKEYHSILVYHTMPYLFHQAEEVLKKNDR
jgi:hypothetical protein